MSAESQLAQVLHESPPSACLQAKGQHLMIIYLLIRTYASVVDMLVSVYAGCSVRERDRDSCQSKKPSAPE